MWSGNDIGLQFDRRIIMMSAYAYNTVEMVEMLCQNVRSVVCTTLKYEYITIMKIISFIFLFND